MTDLARADDAGLIEAYLAHVRVGKRLAERTVALYTEDLVKLAHFAREAAVPLREEVTYTPTPDGITGVQRSIAQLLVEGHVDEAIARRLGMNVRTCRAHIAKLASHLGSGSRAQLGYLIAQSGILDAPES